MNKLNVLKTTSMVLVYLFLYTPIVILFTYSFNKSNFINTWEGFSLQWYSSLLDDRLLLSSALTSLKIASISATVATILGTIAAFALVRFGVFVGKTLFTGLLAAPFIIPEVIIGFAMLLFFVMLENLFGFSRDNGSLVVLMAHTTVGIAYVTLTVQSRLVAFDKSLEEAAMNLGAPPTKVFFLITLPLIAKSLIAGWLLAFTISLDDVVIASFTAGPGVTTLPMLIYSRVKFGISPQINALASVMLGTILLVMIAGYIMSSKEEDED